MPGTHQRTESQNARPTAEGERRSGKTQSDRCEVAQQRRSEQRELGYRQTVDFALGHFQSNLLTVPNHDSIYAHHFPNESFRKQLDPRQAVDR